MKVWLITATIVSGAALGLFVADAIKPTGLRTAPRSPAMHIGIEGAPAAGFVGDFGAGVLSLPPVEIRMSTPRPPKPPPVPCDPGVQNRPGGYFRRVCP